MSEELILKISEIVCYTIILIAYFYFLYKSKD